MYICCIYIPTYRYTRTIIHLEQNIILEICIYCGDTKK